MTEDRKERSPFDAALLSLVVGGLGQLYNGQLRRAVMLYALVILLVAGMIAAPLFFVSLQGIVVFYLMASIAIGIRVFAVVDAFIGARRIGMMELKRYNRWYIYLAIFLAQMSFVEVLKLPVGSYYIPSAAMQPTLLIGDYVRVGKYAYTDRTLER